MSNVLPVTKETSVPQQRAEIPKLGSWRTTAACSKFSAVAGQLLLLHRCLNLGCMCKWTGGGDSQSYMSGSCPVPRSSNKPLVGVSLSSFRLVCSCTQEHFIAMNRLRKLRGDLRAAFEYLKGIYK